MWEDFLAVWNTCIHMVQDISSSGGDLNMLVNSGQTVLRCESNQHDLSVNIYDDRLLPHSVTQKLSNIFNFCDCMLDMMFASHPEQLDVNLFYSIS